MAQAGKALAPESHPMKKRSLVDDTVHAVALFEGLKGLAALALGLGFKALQQRDLHELAVALVGRLHLHADSHLPAVFIGWSDKLQEVHPAQVLALALAYAALRFAEAWGLWRDRPWAEWLAALSTGLYLPFELMHLAHRPSAVSGGVVLFNVAVVALMVWRLRMRHVAAVSTSVS